MGLELIWSSMRGRWFGKSEITVCLRGRYALAIQDLFGEYISKISLGDLVTDIPDYHERFQLLDPLDNIGPLGKRIVMVLR